MRARLRCSVSRLPGVSPSAAAGSSGAPPSEPSPRSEPSPSSDSGGVLLDAGALGVDLLLEGVLGRRLGDVDDEELGVGDQRGAVGQADVAGLELRADRRPVDDEADLLGDVHRVGLDGEGVQRSGRPACRGRPRRGSTTGTSTVTFSPRRTTTRSTCSMKPLIGSRTTLLVSASCGEPAPAMVRTALRPFSRITRGELDGVEGEVHRVGAVSVEDGGDAARATGAPGGALAELGTGLRVDLDVGHEAVTLLRWYGPARRGRRRAEVTPRCAPRRSRRPSRPALAEVGSRPSVPMARGRTGRGAQVVTIRERSAARCRPRPP